MDPEAPSLAQNTTPDTLPTQPAPSEAPVAASLSPEPVSPMPGGVIDAASPSPLKQIRTYQGDVANAIKDQQESIVSIRAAELARANLLKKREEDKDPSEAAATKEQLISISLFIGSLVLILAAGTAIWYAYNTYEQKTAVPTVSIPVNRFLPVVATADTDVSTTTRDALVSLVSAERAKSLPDGNVIHIELRKGTGNAPLETPTGFMLSIQAKPSGSLVRALDPLFMLGVLGESTETGGNQTFLLMKLDSFENAYAGMLEWETTLKEDLLPFFQSPERIANVPSDAAWNDITIKNKDARELRDADGKSVLIYSFYNQNLLIITGSETALRTIITELDTQALAR